MNSKKVFLKTVSSYCLSPGLQCLSAEEPRRNAGPLATGHILLTASKKHRNYITDACAGARHAGVPCAADGHTRACVRGGATHAHRHRDEQNTDTPPAQPPFPSQHQPFCRRNPTQATESRVWPMFSGEVSESCFIFLWGNLLSVWSGSAKPARHGAPGEDKVCLSTARSTRMLQRTSSEQPEWQLSLG